jgi:hypothetical protein
VSSRFLASIFVVGFAVALTSASDGAAQNQKQFPNTRKLGRATVEYRDDVIKTVATYDHSQRHHDSEWLFIDVAVSTIERMKFTRESFALATPSGQTIVLASQRQFAADFPQLRVFLEQSETWLRPANYYFLEKHDDAMKFFVFPGKGISFDEFEVDRLHVADGLLLFESPTGSWESGTHSLVIGRDRVLAEVPIDLE